MLDKQFTISSTVSFEGFGVHTGKSSKIVLESAPENFGINFIINGVLLPVDINYVSNSSLCTTLELSGYKISTVEHFLSAIYSLGITNLKINIIGNEIPILDGSSNEFFYTLKSLLLEQSADKKIINLSNIITIKDMDKFIIALPSNDLKVTYIVDYPKSIIGTMIYSYDHNSSDYENDICQARTFGFFKDFENLKKMNLALGASLDNTLVINGSKYMNNPIYYNEPVRHKILDLLGDLCFLKCDLKANIIAFKTGHSHHLDLVREIIKQQLLH